MTAKKTYKYVIDAQLPTLNEYLAAERRKYKGRRGGYTTGGNEMKHKWQTYITVCIRKSLRGVTIREFQVDIHYDIYEPNKKRDKDNVLAVLQKYNQDALVKTGVLKNDGWNEIRNLSANFYIDKKNPRTEVTLTLV